MTRFVFAILVYLAAVLDSTAWLQFPFEPWRPPFLAALCVTSVMIFSGSSALFWAAVIGLISDSLANGPLGIDMFVMTVSAWALCRVLSTDRRRQAGVILFSSYLAIFCMGLTAGIARSALTDGAIEFSTAFLRVAGDAAIGVTLIAMVLGGTRLAASMLLPPVRTGQGAGLSRLPMLSD